MNTCIGKAEFRYFGIQLDSRSSSKIVMGKLTSKLQETSTKTTTWKIQVRKFTTSKKVNIYFCLSEFSSTKILSWKCHVDNKTNITYDMNLGRDLLTALGLDIKFSETSLIEVKV